MCLKDILSYTQAAVRAMSDAQLGEICTALRMTFDERGYSKGRAQEQLIRFLDQHPECRASTADKLVAKVRTYARYHRPAWGK